MQSIAKSEAQPSPQDLVNPYPLVQLHHWFSMAQWPVTRMKTYLENCRGPAPVAEEMRRRYLSVLHQCEELLQVSLPAHLAEHLAREDAALTAAVSDPRLRKIGVRRRKAPVAAAD